MTPAGPQNFKAMIAGLGGPGIAAVALIAVATVVSAAMLPGLVSAVFTPTPTPVSPPDDAAQDHAERTESSHKRFDGRTMFFVPAKPPPPLPTVEAKGEDNAAPPAPPPPATYGGPAPFAMIFDTVWFADGQKLKAGDDAKGDLQVVRLEAPWAVVLKWKGVEFTVKVFERDGVVLKTPGQKMAEGTPPEPKPAPPAEPAASSAPTSTPPDSTGDPAPPADQPAPPPEPPAGPENNR